MSAMRPMASVLRSGSQSAIFGSIVHSVSFGELEIVDEGAILYDKLTGVITHVFRGSLDELRSSSLVHEMDVRDCSGKLLIPGFVDAHCHAPQYVFSGTGMDLPLLQWLEKYTFPCESKFQDDDFARVGFEASIRRHLKCGTTFSSYFGTLHTSACKILVRFLESQDFINNYSFIGNRTFSSLFRQRLFRIWDKELLSEKFPWIEIPRISILRRR